MPAEQQHTASQGEATNENFTFVMWGAGAARDSPAQTRSEMPVEHTSPNGPTDGAFTHRFEDAEKWAKEFDNPDGGW
jgi:hypothetical protein